MPISIPTNIAGISVPSDFANGPLAALYGNKYKIIGLKYPRDLGTNPARSHAIKFGIWQREPANITQIENSITGLINTLNTGGRRITEAGQAGQNPVERGTAVAASLPEVAKNVGGSVAGLLKTVAVGQDVYTNLGDIHLYVPDTVNVTYNTTYDDISITESLGKALFIAQAGASITDLFSAGMRGESLQNLGNSVLQDSTLRYFGLNAIGRSLGMQNLGQLGLQGINRAINPQLQVLFRGVGFRTFQFDFLLTPYNEKEAEDIKKIIKLFKFYSAPKISSGGGTQTTDVDGTLIESRSDFGSPFFEVPQTFTIEFFHDGKPNTHVNRIARSVLTNINVDYAPNRWATHTEGAPVQIGLTLQFQEIEIIDKRKISEGY